MEVTDSHPEQLVKRYMSSIFSILFNFIPVVLSLADFVFIFRKLKLIDQVCKLEAKSLVDYSPSCGSLVMDEKHAVWKNSDSLFPPQNNQGGGVRLGQRWQVSAFPGHTAVTANSASNQNRKPSNTEKKNLFFLV